MPRKAKSITTPPIVRRLPASGLVDLVGAGTQTPKRKSGVRRSGKKQRADVSPTASPAAVATVFDDRGSETSSAAAYAEDSRLFLLAASREFRCTICLDTYEAPTMVTGCGHVFCRACVMHAIANADSADEQPRCPLCKGRADSRSLVAVGLFADIVNVARRLAEAIGVGDVADMSQSAVLRSINAPVTALMTPPSGPAVPIPPPGQASLLSPPPPLRQGQQGPFRRAGGRSRTPTVGGSVPRIGDDAASASRHRPVTFLADDDDEDDELGPHLTSMMSPNDTLSLIDGRRRVGGMATGGSSGGLDDETVDELDLFGPGSSLIPAPRPGASAAPTVATQRLDTTPRSRLIQRAGGGALAGARPPSNRWFAASAGVLAGSHESLAGPSGVGDTTVPRRRQPLSAAALQPASPPVGRVTQRLPRGALVSRSLLAHDDDDDDDDDDDVSDDDVTQDEPPMVAPADVSRIVAPPSAAPPQRSGGSIADASEATAIAIQASSWRGGGGGGTEDPEELPLVPHHARTVTNTAPSASDPVAPIGAQPLLQPPSSLLATPLVAMSAGVAASNTPLFLPLAQGSPRVAPTGGTAKDGTPTMSAQSPALGASEPSGLLLALRGRQPSNRWTGSTTAAAPSGNSVAATVAVPTPLSTAGEVTPVPKSQSALRRPRSVESRGSSTFDDAAAEASDSTYDALLASPRDARHRGARRHPELPPLASPAPPPRKRHTQERPTSLGRSAATTTPPPQSETSRLLPGASPGPQMTTPLRRATARHHGGVSGSAIGLLPHQQPSSGSASPSTSQRPAFVPSGSRDPSVPSDISVDSASLIPNAATSMPATAAVGVSVKPAVRKKLRQALKEEENRHACVFCGIDVDNRRNVRAFLQLVLGTDPRPNTGLLHSVAPPMLAGILGGVCGPVTINTTSSSTGSTARQVSLHAHQNCLVWCPEMHTASDDGGGRPLAADEMRLHGPDAAARIGSAASRGRGIRCDFCDRRGATLGCFDRRCRKSFHLLCTQLTSNDVCTFVRVADDASNSFPLPGRPGRYRLYCPAHAPAAVAGRRRSAERKAARKSPEQQD